MNNTKPKFYRAFILIFAVIFLVFLIMACIYGLKLNFVDNSDRRIDFEDSGDFWIFVGGAAENEGFYEIRYSTTYGELFLEAGVLTDSSLIIFGNNETVKSFSGDVIGKAVSRKEEYIVCHIEEGFETKNINNADVAGLVNCGMSESSAIAIKNYIKEYGEITDKSLLLEKGLLTEKEYEAVKYKIYAYII